MFSGPPPLALDQGAEITSQEKVIFLNIRCWITCESAVTPATVPVADSEVGQDREKSERRQNGCLKIQSFGGDVHTRSAPELSSTRGITWRSQSWKSGFGGRAQVSCI